MRERERGRERGEGRERERERYFLARNAIEVCLPFHATFLKRSSTQEDRANGCFSLKEFLVAPE